MKHGSDESILPEEQEALLADLESRVRRMQFLLVTDKKREAGKEEEAHLN